MLFSLTVFAVGMEYYFTLDFFFCGLWCCWWLCVSYHLCLNLCTYVCVSSVVIFICKLVFLCTLYFVQFVCVDTFLRMFFSVVTMLWKMLYVFNVMFCAKVWRVVFVTLFFVSYLSLYAKVFFLSWTPELSSCFMFVFVKTRTQCHEFFPIFIY